MIIEIKEEKKKLTPLEECSDPDFKKLMRVAQEEVSSWDNAGSGDNVDVYKKLIDGSPFVLMKTYALVENITPEVIYEVMANQEIRSKWDKVISNFEIIEDFPDEGRSVLYYMVKTPIGVSNRDFVQQRKVKKNFPVEGAITMHFKSVTHPKCPEKSRTVRAETLISGYIMEPATDSKGRPSTRLTIISQNDIKGVVPKTLVNMAAGKGPH